MTQQAQAAVSLRLSNFTVGGGLVDDIDVTITRARFGYGYGQEGQYGELVTFQIDMVDGEGAEHKGYYSVGNGFVPSETGDEAGNGKFLVPVGEKTQPAGGSNFNLWLNSLINAGFPEDLLDAGDVSAIDGVKVHVNRVPAPKRNNLPKRPGAKEGQTETVLLITSILAMPGEAAPVKAGPKAVAGNNKPAAKGPVMATKPAAPAADNPLIEELAGELVGIVAAAGDEGIKKVGIVKELFASIDKSNPNKKELLNLAGKEEVLRSMEMFTFDGKVLKMAE